MKTESMIQTSYDYVKAQVDELKVECNGLEETVFTVLLPLR